MLRLKIRQVIEGFFELGPTDDNVKMQILINFNKVVVNNNVG